MNLLKLTIANGPEMGGSLYLNKDKICGFTPVICRLGPASEYGKEKGSNVLMECHRSYEVEEKVEDICKMLESSDGYLQITSMPKKDQHENTKNWNEQYNELRAKIEFLMSCENPELKFVLNHNLKHILKKHDEQN